MSLLTVTELTCARGGIPVLEGVSLALAPGQVIVLRGPNGSGKTTLLRTLAGLQPPVAGRIEAASEAVAYAGHADGLKPTLTVRENLDFWARLHGTASARALEAFELTDLADRRAGDLSAGQKRRAGLARLVLTGRPVWALDEPTVSLDDRSVATFVAALRAHVAAGGAAIAATHIDLGLAEAEVLDIARLKARAPALDDGAGW